MSPQQHGPDPPLQRGPGASGAPCSPFSLQRAFCTFVEFHGPRVSPHHFTQLLEPHYFLLSESATCPLVSVAAGSAWGFSHAGKGLLPPSQPPPTVTTVDGSVDPSRYFRVNITLGVCTRKEGAATAPTCQLHKLRLLPTRPGGCVLSPASGSSPVKWGDEPRPQS